MNTKNTLGDDIQKALKWIKERICNFNMMCCEFVLYEFTKNNSIGQSDETSKLVDMVVVTLMRSYIKYFGLF